MNQSVISKSIPRISELGTDLLQLTGCQRRRTLSSPFLACAAYWIFAWQGYWAFAVVSLMVMSFLTYGSVSHDLVHQNLGLKRKTNDLFLMVIEAISLRSGHAYQVVHLHHHARFPHDDDIEAGASRMSLVGALLEGFLFQPRIYLWALRHPRGRLNWIIVEGVLVASIIVAAFLLIPVTIVPLVYVCLMIAGSWIIPLITAYIPHNPQGEDAAHQTRLFRGTLFRLIAFDHLYHLEHHLYPNVPHQNWHRLAQRLDPWFKQIGLKSIRSWF
ncbi:fatty acid desaturase [Gimesia chilikensis]|uniref:fatty acid desaturase family protein n=1 Tax=Gimesia chilikensis TaxID=2605989 RepID=UPI0011EFF935|nr:fatty acid desaturase [Gimesia chilikensis]KAA0138449.1 fatty acid desaturase [Gimesia chilikensis]